MSYPISVWQGSFTVFGVELKCHVLDDGHRIIEATSIEALLEAMGDPAVPSNDEHLKEELLRYVLFARGKGVPHGLR